MLENTPPIIFNYNNNLYYTYSDSKTEKLFEFEKTIDQYKQESLVLLKKRFKDDILYLLTTFLERTKDSFVEIEKLKKERETLKGYDKAKVTKRIKKLYQENEYTWTSLKLTETTDELKEQLTNVYFNYTYTINYSVKHSLKATIKNKKEIEQLISKIKKLCSFNDIIKAVVQKERLYQKELLENNIFFKNTTLRPNNRVLYDNTEVSFSKLLEQKEIYCFPQENFIYVRSKEE